MAHRANEKKEQRKEQIVIKWVVSPGRRDRRTGPVPVWKRDPYTQYLMDSETKRIRGIAE